MLPRLPFLLALFVSFTSFSQQFVLPLEQSIYNRYERSVNKKETGFHTSVKPYLQSELDSIISSDSVYGFSPYRIGRRHFPGRVLDNFVNDHLVHVDTGEFELTIDPLFDLKVGKEFADDQRTYVNTRGVYVNGSIGKKFSFSSSFYENQALFVSYLNDYIEQNKVVPGQGEAKPFKSRSYDYSMSTGYISYTPSKHFNFQFGHGKNFFGDGYRSLLLSDNAFNYPYFKIMTTIWKIKYVNLYAQFQDIRQPSPSLLGKGYPKKFGTFHFLSWNVSKRWNLGFFESIIWQGSDSTHYRGFDFNYLNPVIFFRPIEFSLGSADNALMGLNTKFKVSDHVDLFGQFILDDFRFAELKNKKSTYHQKYGFQVGMKAFDIFGIRRLNFHTEYNYVMPYTYSHRLSAQNYGHYNQSLAHPLGANFKESVSFLSYQLKRFSIRTELMYAMFGADSSGKNFGKNIYATEYAAGTSPLNPTNTVGQGLKTNVLYAGVNLAYLVNPKTNMRIELNYTYRKQATDLGSQNTSFISFGIRTALMNHYYDF